MEVIFQDSIGFIYDVCRVIICKSNKRESWINAFLCDGSEEEDMLYIDNLLKKFQGIEISNKLLGYKNINNHDALLSEIYAKYVEEKLGQVDINDFLLYVTDSTMLKEAVAEYYLNVTTVNQEKILESISNSKYNLEVKAELYDFFLFTEKNIEIIKVQLASIVEAMQRMYNEAKNIVNQVLKHKFQIDGFLQNMKEYLQNDTWEEGIKKYTVTFSFSNRYLVLRQLDKCGDGIIILGIDYEQFFFSKKKKQMNLVSFGNALGDKIRMKMITLLEEHGELTLTDFSNKLDIVNAVALYHLDILKEAKLILRRNEGRRVLYWLNRGQFIKAIEEVEKIAGRCKNEKLEKACCDNDFS